MGWGKGGWIDPLSHARHIQHKVGSCPPVVCVCGKGEKERVVHHLPWIHPPSLSHPVGSIHTMYAYKRWDPPLWFRLWGLDCMSQKKCRHIQAGRFDHYKDWEAETVPCNYFMACFKAVCGPMQACLSPQSLNGPNQSTNSRREEKLLFPQQAGSGKAVGTETKYRCMCPRGIDV